MPHKDFKYVECAFGDVSHRNNIKDISSLELSEVGGECYASMYRFTVQLVDHVKEKGSVKGVSCLPVWSDYLWFDVDSPDLRVAQAAAILLVDRIVALDASLAELLIIYFSGCKGFHIGLPSLLAGLKPSKLLPSQHKQLAIALAEGIEIDTSIYEHTRLWRLPNSVNAKSGLYKVQISIEQLNNWSIEQIQEYAKQPRGEPKIDILEGTEQPPVCDRLFELLEQADQADKTTVHSPVTSHDTKDPNWIATALENLGVGNRHNTFLHITGRLHCANIPPESILQLLGPHAERSGFPSDELQALVNDVCTRYGNNSSLFEDYNSAQTKSEMEAVPLAAFLSTKRDVDVTWRVDKVIASDGTAILAGPPECGKSFMLMDLTIAVATGTKFLARYDTIQGSVLYVDEENFAEEIQRRFWRLLKGRDLNNAPPGIFVAVCQDLQLNDKASIARFDRLLSRLQPQVVLIDALIRVLGVEENSATEMSRVFRTLKMLVHKHNCCIVMADHHRKPGNIRYSSGVLLRGSSDKLAFVDTLMSVQELQPGVFRIEHTKSRRGKPVPAIAVRLDDTPDGGITIKYAGNPQDFTRKDPTEKVISFLLDTIGEKWVSRKKILLLAKEVGFSEQSIDKGLEHLSSRNILEKDKEKRTGRGAPGDCYRKATNDTTSQGGDQDAPDKGQLL